MRPVVICPYLSSSEDLQRLLHAEHLAQALPQLFLCFCHLLLFVLRERHSMRGASVQDSIRQET